MRHSIEDVQSLIAKTLGNCPLADASKIYLVFARYLDFWQNAEENRKLKIELHLEVKRLTGDDGQITINLADMLIREQAGLPQREDDTDPVYEDYDKRAGDIILLNDDVTEVMIIGPSPTSPFRWAVVKSLNDDVAWLMSWVVIREHKVKARGESSMRATTRNKEVSEHGV